MSLKTSIINSSQASYRDNEYNILLRLLCSEGVFNVGANNDDFQVIENPSGADMDVYCKVGAALVQYTKTGVTWKVIVEGAEQQSDTVSANSTGSNRIDAAVIVLAQTEPNAQKNNVASFQIITGTGTSAMTDNEVDTAIGHSNWMRLADITVANGATSISNSDITDVRDAVSFGNVTAGYQTIYYGYGANLSGIITNPFTADILPDSDAAHDLGASGTRLANIYAQYFHGDGSNLTNVPSAGVTETYTFGEDYPINDLPKVMSLTEDSDGGQIYDTNWSGQNFTAPSDMSEISAVELLLWKDGTPTETFTVGVYDVDGSGHPTGAALGSTTLQTRYIHGDNGTGVWLKFTFSSPIAITGGSTYAIVASMANGSTTNNIRWKYDSTAPFAGGVALTSTDSGSTWSNQTYDRAFVVYGDTDEPYPLYLENGQYTELLLNASDDLNNNGAIYTTRQRAQNFKTIGYNYITRIETQLSTQGTVAGSTNVTFALYAADASGHPTGSAVFSSTDTITNWGITGTDQYIEVTVNTAVTEDSEYVWVISMASTGDASNYLDWGYANAEVADWRYGHYITSTDGGSTWSNGNSAASMRLWGYQTRTQGQVYRVDPSHVDRWKPVGWKETNDAVTSGNTDTIRISGKVETFTGLTAGQEYFIPLEMDLATNGASYPILPNFTESGTYAAYLATSIVWSGFQHRPWVGGPMLSMGQASATDTLLLDNPSSWGLIPFAVVSDYNQDVTQDTVITVPKRAKAAIVDMHYQIGTDDSYDRFVIYKNEGANKTHRWFQRDAGEYGVSIVWDDDAETITCSDAGTSITRDNTFVTFLG